MKRKDATLALGVGVIGLLALVFRPVPVVREEAALKVAGVLEEVWGDNNLDVQFRLENNPVRYYVNRGINEGLDLQYLQNECIGKEVVLHYPVYWTPLDPFHQVRHVSRVTVGETVLFNELK